MIGGFLHLVTSQPRDLSSRYQRIGILNHLGEWHWHRKRIALLTILLFGEAGGLYMSYLERSWIVRPFSTTELVARVEAALRRRDAPAKEPDEGSFHLGELAIDYARRRVTVAGRAVAMTETEYRLLCELAVNVGRTLSREHLMSRVWSTREQDDSSMLRGYVMSLRRKLGETADNPRYIFNEPRVGYRLGEAEGRDGV